MLERCVALKILLGKDKPCLVRGNGLAGLLDDKLLLANLLADRLNGRLCGCDVRARLVQRRLIVPRVDLRDNLARLDAFVVVNGSRRSGSGITGTSIPVPISGTAPPTSATTIKPMNGRMAGTTSAGFMARSCPACSGPRTFG
jgi:hypothetical protein